jgi:hypothetical protein
MTTRRTWALCVIAIAIGCANGPATTGWGTENTGGGDDGGGSPEKDASQPDSGTSSRGDDAADEAATGDDGGSTADADAGAPMMDAMPQACPYPSGPYGTMMGQVVSPSLTWQGYAEGSSNLTTIKATDYFDCDGSKGINALVFDESATWCGACQTEAMDIPAQMAGQWGTDGVHIVTLMIEDANSQPATTQTALDWRNQFSLSSIAVVADPNFIFSMQGTNGLPTNILVDPRTMTIVALTQGYGGPDPAIDQLAQKNKK